MPRKFKMSFTFEAGGIPLILIRLFAIRPPPTRPGVAIFPDRKFSDRLIAGAVVARGSGKLGPVGGSMGRPFISAPPRREVFCAAVRSAADVWSLVISRSKVGCELGQMVGRIVAGWLKTAFITYRNGYMFWSWRKFGFIAIDKTFLPDWPQLKLIWTIRYIDFQCVGGDSWEHAQPPRRKKKWQKRHRLLVRPADSQREFPLCQTGPRNWPSGKSRSWKQTGNILKRDTW